MQVMMKRILTVFFLCVFPVICGGTVKQQVDIVPAPAQMTVKNGILKLDGVKILKDSLIDKETAEMIDGFASVLSRQSGLGKESSKAFRFIFDKNIGEEAYGINVSRRGVKVTASSKAGFFYAIQTLKQMFPIAIYGGSPDFEAAWILPCVEIKDKPAFSYRGFLLDPCRHFFSIEETKKLIDLASMYKINRMHWHLTDDQGWRIEIKKYPKLTEIGSVRSGTQIGYDRDSSDGIPVSGFYTQEDVRDIIKYAEERCITIVPEVDLPGHMLAALAPYPEFGCTDGPYEVCKSWGVSSKVLCPAKPETMQFLKDVTGELAEIFPGEYFHIGGDECPKTEWENNPLCQAFIDSLGFVSNENGTKEQRLQNWVTKEMQDFLASKGKKIIGWDEILEGDLAEGATVMSWRGPKGGIKAAQSGFDVIMTPNSYLYFDYAQSPRLDIEPASITLDVSRAITWQKTYSFNPYDQLNEEERSHIIGIQSNIWTEYISTNEYLEFMFIPRIFPLVELQWSPAATRNERRMEKSMASHQLPIMDLMGYNYRPLDYVKNVCKADVKDSKKLKLLYWNIQNGMWADQGNNYDNFVEWIKTYDPDVCVWCEARTLYWTDTYTKIDDDKRTLCRTMGSTTDEGWSELAGRYGHKYVFIGGFRDNYPQVITSKYPIGEIKHITGDKNENYVSHGAGWATLDFAGETINLVCLHTWPHKFDHGLPHDEKIRKESAENGGGDKFRAKEVEYICKSTILSEPGLSGENWIMMGDFNSISPLDYAVYRYKKDNPVFNCHRYILENTPYIDVIGERNPGKFIPSTNIKRRIDYVYCTKKMYDRITDAYGVVDDWTLCRPVESVPSFRYPSDHRPVYVEFQF